MNRKRAGTRKRERRRPASLGAKIIKYGVLTVAGVVAFCLLSSYAYGVRGYRAVGGEVFALGLPVLYHALEKVVVDYFEDFRGGENLW